MIHEIISKDTEPQSGAARRIRSFVRRQGRLTKGQQFALTHYWSKLGVEFSPEQLVFQRLFEREAPIVLEVGFGMGTSLVQIAQQHPEQNFLGIEVHSPGVGACLAAAQKAKLNNLRLMCHDAFEVLEVMIPDNALAQVLLFFPDPWHKARHHKRRIVQASFAELVRRKLVIGGVLHMATDWEDYAQHMLAVMQRVSGYQNLAYDNGYTPRPDSRPFTKFELRGQRLGHGNWDIMFKRVT